MFLDFSLEINEGMDHLGKLYYLLTALMLVSGLLLRVDNADLIFLFLNQNICCGHSKEPSQ